MTPGEGRLRLVVPTERGDVQLAGGLPALRQFLVDLGAGEIEISIQPNGREHAKPAVAAESTLELVPVRAGRNAPRICPKCGLPTKGPIGLAVHLRRRHGIKGKAG